MNKPVVVSQSPNKPNVFYSVIMKSSPLEEVFAPLVEELRTIREAIERVIIFGQTYDNVTDLYLFFKNRLGNEISQPPGLQHLARF